jgi:hypothetical protein
VNHKRRGRIVSRLHPHSAEGNSLSATRVNYLKFMGDFCHSRVSNKATSEIGYVV